MTPIRPDRFLIYGQPQITEAEVGEVVDCMNSRWLGTGPRVAAFEKDFHTYKGGWGSALAVNSCTAALHLALVVLDLEPGDEVITTPYTFCATINAIIHAGGTPVLVDVDPKNWNIDPNGIKAAITPRTRAVIPVHFTGNPCDMGAISNIAQQHDLAVIEDCAHAVEATIDGKHCGTFGDFGCFSFYATKNLTTGEGGLLLSADADQHERARALSLHGMSRHAWNRYGSGGYRHYEVVEPGFKYNMMDLQAAIGHHQLQRITTNLKRRDAIWDRYQQELGDLPLTLPPEAAPNAVHARHLYSILIDEAHTGIKRDDFIPKMTAHGIGTGVHYRTISQHRYYQERFGWQPEDTPHATRLGNQTVSIPLSPALSDDDVADVIAAIHDIIGT